MRPDRSRPGGRALTASVVLHVVFFALLFVGVARPSPLPQFKAYRVELVAAPPPAPVEKETPVAEKQPESQPAPKPPPKTPEPKAKAKAEPPKPKPEPKTEKAEPKEQPASKPKDEETTGTGQDALNLSLKGAESEYSGYYANVTTQINRYFRWTGTAHPVAEVYFVINRDGSVGDIRLVRRSGNPAFDFEAIGAIEQAGQRHAFGPLPEGLGDRLPVRFTFQPPQ
jgi:protein TonB